MVWVQNYERLWEPKGIVPYYSTIYFESSKVKNIYLLVTNLYRSLSSISYFIMTLCILKIMIIFIFSIWLYLFKFLWYFSIPSECSFMEYYILFWTVVNFKLKATILRKKYDCLYFFLNILFCCYMLCLSNYYI